MRRSLKQQQQQQHRRRRRQRLSSLTFQRLLQRATCPMTRIAARQAAPAAPARGSTFTCNMPQQQHHHQQQQQQRQQQQQQQLHPHPASVICRLWTRMS